LEFRESSKVGRRDGEQEVLLHAEGAIDPYLAISIVMERDADGAGGCVPVQTR